MREKLARFLIPVLVIPTVTISTLSADPFEQKDLKPAACIVIGSDDDALRSIYNRLKRNGARALHVFPPDVIFGRLPSGLGENDFGDLRVRLAWSPDEIPAGELDAFTLGIIQDLFNERELRMLSEMPDDPNFSDMVLQIPPDKLPPGTGLGKRTGAPSEIGERNIWQNSELLIGTVLINVVFPESEAGTEDWTTDEIMDALSGIARGVGELQQNLHWVDLDFFYNYEDYMKVEISAEPIETYWTEHYFWIVETMEELGYVSDDTLLVDSGAVNKLNNETRQRFGTDWAFTVFVADQSYHYNPSPPYPDPDCWAGSGVISYAYLGGPYLVLSYPACKLGHGAGFNRVFVHEMCHVFWALDEYYSAQMDCDAVSGYLAYPNRNTLFNKCQEVTLCIMMGVSYGPTLPICKYTLGQMGLTDEDENSVPDIFEIPPEIEFIDLPGVNADTIYKDAWVTGARAVNRAYPNQNVKQLVFYADEMVDYGAWLVDGQYQINGEFPYELQPADGKWNSSRESIGCMISGFEPGHNTFSITVKNCADAKTTAETDVYFIGLKYYETACFPESDCIDVMWVTASEVFGASFTVEREDLGAGTPPAVVDTVTAPEDIGDRKRCYVYRDKTVMAGHSYRYRITGSFGLLIDSKDTHFEYTSGDIYSAAPIPVESDLISHIVPNPTSGRVTFTFEVPEPEVDDMALMNTSRRPYAGVGTQITPRKMPVDVSIYNVKGQLVRNLYSMDLYSGFKTMSWDGMDSNGREAAAGVYFIRVKIDRHEAVRKVVLLR